MYTQHQAITIKNYYQTLLPDWKLSIVFPIQDGKEIFGAIPKEDTLFGIYCLRELESMTLKEACYKLNLLQPHQIQNLL